MYTWTPTALRCFSQAKPSAVRVPRTLLLVRLDDPDSAYEALMSTSLFCVIDTAGNQIPSSGFPPRRAAIMKNTKGFMNLLDSTYPNIPTRLRNPDPQ